MSASAVSSRSWFRAALFCVSCCASVAFAAGDDEMFSQYREMLGEGNPAELVEMQGEELWSAARGPKNKPLSACDLGLGAGVVAGAYASLPRYFKDAGRVMDLETRLAWCMNDIQGLSESAVTARPFSVQGQTATDLEALTAWIAGQSRGKVISVPQKHAKEQAAFAEGKRLFNYRAGPYDFSCAGCHSQSSKRIRLTVLPNLTTQEGAANAYRSWPAYRVSQGALRTMQWRMVDCARQQRLPELIFGSPAAVSLLTYLGATANGGIMDAPGIKR
ncbi:sulfur oxidation c-type cytochrome SoxA [Panacagrimonas perspica]|nr:sulfur oxidation c-type cytochrome SoxA [Panacagrimonas perspica]THD02123.1 sulfur oxidation c-type cytochrome SoxA [Panacagrimonas perspica]